ncbi:MAG: exo-alpha-sialidase [Cyclobacteriaceae bacterium]
MKTSILLTVGLLLLTHGLSVAQNDTRLIRNTQEGKLTSDGLWISDDVQEITGLNKMGPFVRLSDGSILTIDTTTTFISKDEGKTWTEYPVFKEPDKFSISKERALIRTRSGVIILAFINMEEVGKFEWQADIMDFPAEKAIAPTYAIRSLDNGKTWQDLQKLHNDWTGAIRDIIETRDGSVVFTSMMMRHNPGRHSVVTYTSKDDGKRWVRSNVIDLGGIGHHGGVTESTIEQLRDGRLWMLMRTNWGKFWEAYSPDEGLTWKNFKPTDIDASAAPGLLKRLQSGRLVLVWNRVYAEGKTEYPAKGGDGQWSEVPASWNREDLSIMFSNDEGKSWSPPRVFSKIVKQGTARETLLGLSYPYFFEAKPGEIWITTMFGGLRCKLYEKDFIAAQPDSLVIVAFGNSITATRKTINQVFAQRLPGLLAEKEVYAKVINSGVGGSHTGRLSDNNLHKVRHASDRFESDVLSHQPDAVIISFGTNDSFIDSRKASGQSRISLKDYEKNLTHFIETLQNRKIRVILIAPGPFVKEYEGFQNERLLQYIQVVRKLAKKYRTGLVDNSNEFNKYTADTGESVDALMLDASHPNDKGHKIIADNLVKEIVRVMAVTYE